jgi:hypothetical protein
VVTTTDKNKELKFLADLQSSCLVNTGDYHSMNFQGTMEPVPAMMPPSLTVSDLARIKNPEASFLRSYPSTQQKDPYLET